MLLSFRKKPLRIVLAADRVIASEARPVAVEPTGDWQPAVQALPAILHGRKGQAAVVLADQFVRYTLLQPNESLKTEEQWLALARHRFTAVHGSRAADWEVKLTETAPSGPRLACAVDKRLIRVFCKSCHGKGCALCRGSGFKGRKAVGELLVLNDEMRELIIARAPARKLKETARANGTVPLREAAMQLVESGQTTQGEIDRVTFVS